MLGNTWTRSDFCADERDDDYVDNYKGVINDHCIDCDTDSMSSKVWKKLDI